MNQQHAGMKVTVMGLGLFGGGASVARFFAERGAKVTVTDLRTEQVLAPALHELRELPLRYVLGQHDGADFREADLIVANPGVPPSSSYLEVARQADVPITSEIALFLNRTRARLCAVTGTQGKSSTCNLLTGLLLGTEHSAYLGGNIGGSLLDRVDEFTEDEIVVLELSSYQLEALALERSSPRCFEAVAILNLREDHLARHGTLEAYAAAKLQLLHHVRPGGSVFLPARDPLLRNCAPDDTTLIEFSTDENSDALHIDTGEFRWNDQRLASVSDLRLPGEFQRPNALVALGIAHAMGAPAKALPAALRTCRGLPHRLEDLGAIAGCRVWDNAISTTPDSTVAAMNSLEPGFTLLLGGLLKESSLDELARCARERASHSICFGSGAADFERALREAGASCESTDSLHEAVALAYRSMKAKDELLFSPAAASFDAYPNVQARALDFRVALRDQAEAAQSSGRAQDANA